MTNASWYLFLYKCDTSALLLKLNFYLMYESFCVFYFKHALLAPLFHEMICPHFWQQQAFSCWINGGIIRKSSRINKKQYPPWLKRQLKRALISLMFNFIKTDYNTRYHRGLLSNISFFKGLKSRVIVRNKLKCQRTKFFHILSENLIIFLRLYTDASSHILMI